MELYVLQTELNQKQVHPRTIISPDLPRDNSSQGHRCLYTTAHVSRAITKQNYTTRNSLFSAELPTRDTTCTTPGFNAQILEPGQPSGISPLPTCQVSTLSS